MELAARASIYWGPTQARVQVQHTLQYLTFNFGLEFQFFFIPIHAAFLYTDIETEPIEKQRPRKGHLWL